MFHRVINVCLLAGLLRHIQRDKIYYITWAICLIYKCFIIKIVGHTSWSPFHLRFVVIRFYLAKLRSYFVPIIFVKYFQIVFHRILPHLLFIVFGVITTRILIFLHPVLYEIIFLSNLFSLALSIFWNISATSGVTESALGSLYSNHFKLDTQEDMPTTMNQIKDHSNPSEDFDEVQLCS